MDSLLLPLMSPREIASYLGARVRARRKFLKLSRRELAEKSGISEQTIGRLETKGIASINALVKIAIALNATDSFAGFFELPKARSFDELMERDQELR